MAVEYDNNGIPILSNKSFLTDTPAYTQSLAQLVETIAPIGLIQPYAGPINDLANVLGPYWLPCDGSIIPSDARYQKLRDRIGHVYDHPDMREYRLPDLQGRGLAGAGQDAQAQTQNLVFGRKYGDYRLHNHNHGATGGAHSHHAISAGGGDGSATLANWTVGGASMLGGRAPFGATGTQTVAVTVSNSTFGGSSQNQSPVQVVNFIILAARE